MADRRYWTATFDQDTWGRRVAGRLHWSASSKKLLRTLEPGDIVFGYVTKVGWAAVYEATSTARDDVEGSKYRTEYPIVAEVKECLLLDLDDAIHPRDLPADDPLLRQRGNRPAVPYLYQRQGTLLGEEVGERLYQVITEWWSDLHPEVGIEVEHGALVVATSGAGRQPDVEVRLAIERHAMNEATKHFETMGFVIEDVSKHESYDLRATKGTDVRRVEVKGSARRAGTVELTRGEVRAAGASGRSSLVVVDDISWERSDGSGVSTQGGSLRIWDPWTPDSADLEPLTYQYRLPPSAEVPRG
jgi:hypothetical protein